MLVDLIEFKIAKYKRMYGLSWRIMLVLDRVKDIKNVYRRKL